MKRNWQRHLYLVLGIGAGGILILGLKTALLPPLFLEVRDTQTGSLLLAFPVKKGKTFQFQYTHSTAKTGIEEHFQIAGPDDIILTRMVYSSAGAGIPDLPPEGGRFRVGVDGRFIMDDLNLKFPSLENVRIAFFYPFLLGFEGKFYDLTEIARGRLVNIRIRH